jgi:hypothetical protein
LAKAEWTLEDQWSPHDGAECEGELYQTRGGAFFLVTTIHTKNLDGEPKDKVEFEPMTTERAQEWLLEGDVAIYRNPFDDPPEAAAESEGGATIYIRVPAALKRDVDEAAREAKISRNVWAMRCVEQCLDGFPKQMAAIWHIAKGLTAVWSADKAACAAAGREVGCDAKLDSYRLDTAERALDEIADLVEDFAKRHFGTNDLAEITGSFLLGPEAADLSQRYKPYPED